MARRTQKSHLYYFNPGDSSPSILRVSGITGFNPGGNSADQIEVTALEHKDRRYQPGLRTPGQASLSVNTDPRDQVHLNLHALTKHEPQPVLRWALGMSESGEAPGLDDSGGFWVLPNTRSWLLFDGYLSDFPLDFAQNSVVNAAVSIQRSGDLGLVRRGYPVEMTDYAWRDLNTWHDFDTWARIKVSH